MTNWYGSLSNRLKEGMQTDEPYVGMGATEFYYSDREPYTVQQVISPSRVVVTADKYRRIDNNGRSDCQDYEYESVPLKTTEVSKRCTHVNSTYFKNAPMACMTKADKGCEGCEFYKGKTRTNGITLIKTKRGWKALGKERRFALGFREAYEDPSF